MQEAMCGLSGVPMTRMSGMKDIADLCTTMLSGGPPEKHVTDQLTSGSELDTQKQGVALGREDLASPEAAQTISHGRGVHWLERHEPAHLRKRSVRDQRFNVALRDR